MGWVIPHDKVNIIIISSSSIVVVSVVLIFYCFTELYIMECSVQILWLN